ncbi:lipase 3 [Harpegnathos saltator]|uniref:Lipase n=1 Tax=Harpegnathos saltator TaxID=610380 RepID=E2BNC8_HARSA|nr:lipase 3 [Harpegnathos saltator]EFN82798.1 Lipase 3 [Harpegnathos saltator]
MLTVLLFTILAFANATLDPELRILADENLAKLKLNEDLPPDAKLNTMELIEKYHYKPEKHVVITPDGYILELHRIVGRTNSTEQRPVALVMHGLLASSAVWVLSEPKKSLGFILSDAGYDVWLGNVRGSMYSRTHKNPSIAKEDYWNFSWHEIATRDLPTMIDYILKTTGREKLFYLGHSQGTTTFFVMSAQLPEYQNKIHAMFAMAPVVYCSNMISPIFRLLAVFSTPIDLVAKLIGQYEFEPTNEAMQKFQALVCAKDAITQPLCSNMLFLIGGYDRDQFNKTLLPIVLGHVPAGAATKQFVHYAQLINSGKFRQFDYGFFGNLGIYNRIFPPKYDLSKIRVPISLHYSSNDWLADVEDVHQLYKELGKPFGKFRVPHDKFNHLDYMWAKDVDTLLYDKILSLMTRFKD